MSMTKQKRTQYIIHNGQLSSLSSSHSNQRVRHWIECVTKMESKKLATLIQMGIHTNGNAWSGLQPQAWCVNHNHYHVLSAKTWTWTHYYSELLVGDYLQLSIGKGGYHTLGVYLEPFSQHVWVYKCKMASSSKTTINRLGQMFSGYLGPETLTDSTWHFNSQEVCNWDTNMHVIYCRRYILEWLYAPALDQHRFTKAWLDHLSAAILAQDFTSRAQKTSIWYVCWPPCCSPSNCFVHC